MSLFPRMLIFEVLHMSHLTTFDMDNQWFPLHKGSETALLPPMKALFPHRALAFPLIALSIIPLR